MNINIENAHAYTLAWFNAANAERKAKKQILTNLATYCPDIIDDPIYLDNEIDVAYMFRSPRGITLAISGTRNWKGWKRNARIRENDGWHRGFRESFDKLIKKPLEHYLNEWPGLKLWIYAHSAGPAIGLNAAYFVRNWLKRDCEVIGFCAPQAMNSKGVAQCRKEHVCATMCNIGRHDPVDDIMKVISKVIRPLDAQDYGKIQMLPDLPGIPNALDNDLANMFFGGHAPSYVNQCLQKMYMNWGRPDWQKQVEYLQAVIGVAIK